MSEIARASVRTAALLLLLLSLGLAASQPALAWGVSCTEGGPRLDLQGNGITLDPPASRTYKVPSKGDLPALTATYRWKHVATLITQDGGGHLTLAQKNFASRSSAVVNAMASEVGASVSAGVDAVVAKVETKLTTRFSEETKTTTADFASTSETDTRQFDFSPGSAVQLWQKIIDYRSDATGALFTVATTERVECYYAIDFDKEPRLYVNGKSLRFPPSPRVVDGKACFYAGNDPSKCKPHYTPGKLSLDAEIGESVAHRDMVLAFRKRWTDQPRALYFPAYDYCLSANTGYWTNLFQQSLANCSWQSFFAKQPSGSDRQTVDFYWNVDGYDKKMTNCAACAPSMRGACDHHRGQGVSSCFLETALNKGCQYGYPDGVDNEAFIENVCADFRTIAAGGKPVWFSAADKKRMKLPVVVSLSWVDPEPTDATTDTYVTIAFAESTKVSRAEEQSFGKSVGLEVGASADVDGATFGASLSASISESTSRSWGMSQGSASSSTYSVGPLTSHAVRWALGVSYGVGDKKKTIWTPHSNVFLVLADVPQPAVKYRDNVWLGFVDWSFPVNGVDVSQGYADIRNDGKSVVVDELVRSEFVLLRASDEGGDGPVRFGDEVVVRFGKSGSERFFASNGGAYTPVPIITVPYEETPGPASIWTVRKPHDLDGKGQEQVLSGTAVCLETLVDSETQAAIKPADCATNDNCTKVYLGLSLPNEEDPPYTVTTLNHCPWDGWTVQGAGTGSG